MQVRRAVADDVQAIRECDVYAHSNRDRVRFIVASVAQERCLIATGEGRVLGYVVLTHDFFGHGFISVVVVSPAHRRTGVGLKLLSAAEAVCRSPKLFTSANLSNLPSQKLILKAGFQRSGVIENLDEDDPELIYVKFIR
jgi:ribosomal protein S18 acetylase RimI-like enzyme